MSQEIRNKAPKFTKEQLDWLESRFPENLNYSADPLALARSQGERNVLFSIRQEIAYVVADVNRPRSL